MTKPKYKTLDGKWIRGYIVDEPEQTEGLYPFIVNPDLKNKKDENL